MTLSAPSPYLPGKRARTAVLCVAGLCAAASHFEIDHRHSCPNLLLDPVSRPVDRLAQHIVHQMRVALRDGYALVTAPCQPRAKARAHTRTAGPQKSYEPTMERWPALIHTMDRSAQRCCSSWSMAVPRPGIAGREDGVEATTLPMDASASDASASDTTGTGTGVDPPADDSGSSGGAYSAGPPCPDPDPVDLAQCEQLGAPACGDGLIGALEECEGGAGCRTCVDASEPEPWISSRASTVSPTRTSRPLGPSRSSAAP